VLVQIIDTEKYIRVISVQNFESCSYFNMKSEPPTLFKMSADDEIVTTTALYPLQTTLSRFQVLSIITQRSL